MILLRPISTLLAGLVLAGWACLAQGQSLYLVDGNPNCSNLHESVPGLSGPLFGFKYDNNPTGDVSSAIVNGNPWVITNGIEDPGNSVSIFNVVVDGGEGIQFDWSATLGIDAVIAKGGANANAYVYIPEATGGSGLVAPNGAAVSHVEFCYDYELTVEKTAAGTYDRDIDWTITKDVDPATHALFAGESAESGYTVTATKAVVESGYAVTGTITVTNPSPLDVNIAVTDTMDGVTASVDCGSGNGGSTTVAAGSDLICFYSADETDGVNGDETLNTASVTSLTDGIAGGVATASIAFVPTLIGEPEDVNVTDTNGQTWQANDSTSWSYARTFDCSTDLADYGATGTYSFEQDNVATIDETGDSDNALVTVDCYAPLVTKTAATAYTRTYDWTITKNVVASAYTGFPGDSFTADYTVTVDQTIIDSDFRISGTISVANPHPSKSMTVSLSDFVGGNAAALDCGGTLVVGPASSGSCDYGVDLAAAIDGTNTATATFNGIGFDATAPYAFGNPTTIVGEAVIDVMDYYNGDTGGVTLGTASSATSFTYTHTVACSADAGQYTNGSYTEAFPNTAEIDQTGQSDDAGVDLTCYLPASARVVKTTTEGPEAIGQFPFTFSLYDPSSNMVESATLNAAGEIAFDTEIETEGTWTVVETLPNGWVNDALTCTFDVSFPNSADATYTCTFDNVEMSRLDLFKLTNGVETTAQTWSFALYEGPDGFEGTMVASDGTPPALLDFGNADLDPRSVYTLCELEVPAGYSTFWQIDTTSDGLPDTTVLPYNPNANDDPPEDLGNRCVDLGAGTPYPLVPGTTLSFTVDNRMPGGAPRTPGYWKNWNTCTNGGQQYTAEANGGWEQGFWLLEDVLNPSIGGGITWDNILEDDSFEYPITDCAVAVDLLDKREVGDPAVVGDGKKSASDPLVNLATHLLAAQLNFGAGACTTQDVLDTALAAEAFLDEWDFDGTAGLGPRGRAAQDFKADANALAAYLDDYNNGEFCGDGSE